MQPPTLPNHALENAPTTHRIILGDARGMDFIPDESVHLIVTSPPYWNLKRYNENPAQLGHVEDYELFVAELAKVWLHAIRTLVPGGRLVCVVGDVCLSRRSFGRHVVFPLHSDIAVTCRKLGFDNLNPIIWHKIANANYEVNNGTKFLGKPYEPNAIIKNDIEFILMQRKPGGYRKPTPEQRALSMIAKSDYDAWFRQFWTITGASTRHHPAPFPLELANRLVRMFSFYGDTVLDPFAGSGTTLLAALRAGRNSIGIDIDAEYCRMASQRLQAETATLFSKATLKYEVAADQGRGAVQIRETTSEYSARTRKAKPASPARRRIKGSPASTTNPHPVAKARSASKTRRAA